MGLPRSRCRQWSQPVGGSSITEAAQGTKKTGKGDQFDSSKLKNDRIRQDFRRELKNRSQILGEEQEMNIDSVNQVFKAAGEEVLGRQDL